MKVLPLEFTKNGYKFKQIKRTGAIALYKKTPFSTSNFGYEVIIITSHNGYNLGGSFIEPSETYPSSSLWGQKGWTYMYSQPDKAEKKFEELCRAQDRKAINN